MKGIAVEDQVAGSEITTLSTPAPEVFGVHILLPSIRTRFLVVSSCKVPLVPTGEFSIFIERYKLSLVFPLVIVQEKRKKFLSLVTQTRVNSEKLVGPLPSEQWVRKWVREHFAV